MSALTTSAHRARVGASQGSEARKRNERHTHQKGNSKTISVHRQCNLVCKNPEESTKKLLELIDGFRKVAGYRINI